ncbi:MAG: CoA-binding protein [Deltaproteobacteria bacterium]|nr:CoA-binding protein [Deltaproteobacteria bacterium]
MGPEERQQLDRIFNPRGFALFGGIGTPASFGQFILLSHIRYGYKGRLYPISSKGGEVAGVKTYQRLKDVKGPVDLASISVPAKAVPGVVEDCLNHGVAGVQIHSSGFAETGTEAGVALEAEIARIAARGIRVIGPNCFGIHTPRGGLTLLPGFDFSHKPGPIGMISQSGGVATDLGHEAPSLGLGLSKVISFGNGCDLDAVALLEYLAWDPETRYIVAYLEGVRDGRRFVDLLRQTTRKKPVVVWKAGLTPLGGRAAKSHTGSLAGEARMWDGVLSQAGAAPVQGLDEILDTLVALTYLKNIGPRIALVGGGGAIGVFSSDLASRWGLDVPVFSQETRKRLRRFFPTPGNSMMNPLDTGSPALPVETITALCTEVLAGEPIDVLIVVVLLRTIEVEMQALYAAGSLETVSGGRYLRGFIEPLAQLKRETGKEVVMVFDNRAHLSKEAGVEAISREVRDQFQAAGIPVYPSTERALRGIHHALVSLRHGSS